MFGWSGISVRDNFRNKTGLHRNEIAIIGLEWILVKNIVITWIGWHVFTEIKVAITDQKRTNKSRY